MRKYIGIFLFLSLVWACSSDSDDNKRQGKFDRKAMLVNWADNIIIPSYDAFLVEVGNLKTTFAAFKTTTDQTNLTVLRTAWLKTYKLWQHVSMFEIGPAESIDLRYNVNLYPTKASEIETNVLNGNSDFSLPSNRVEKGFPALDYLINGLGDTDVAILAKYTENTGEAYMAYIDKIISDLEQLTKGVVSKWKGEYKGVFVNNDGASVTASVDRFVNDYIFYYEKILRAGKMGIPLGVFSGFKSPQNLEAFYYKSDASSDASKELFLEGLNASQDFFNGKHFGKDAKGESLNSYLTTLNTVKKGVDLSKLISDQFDKARTKVSELGTFMEELEDSEASELMNLAYDEVQRLVVLFKTDMISAMSINIDYTDADGD